MWQAQPGEALEYVMVNVEEEVFGKILGGFSSADVRLLSRDGVPIFSSVRPGAAG